jgi:phosphoribosylaminoimidazole-succinocarboxamide synthase
VSTDRISAFDWVLPTGIPDKGRVLTQLSNFWFQHLKVANHLIETDVHKMNLPADADLSELAGRTILVRKTEVVPIECVVRGFLSGSAWQEYIDYGKICGIEMPTGLQESARLPSMIFSPATKAEQGEHDENITYPQMCDLVGAELGEQLRSLSIEIYQQGASHARGKGIIVADTKFEFGLVDNEIILIDEVLTPDSSRFWPADLFQPGRPQPSFDKQFVRDWLTHTGWDKQSSPPELPPDVVARPREKYIDAFERITGGEFPWK